MRPGRQWDIQRELNARIPRGSLDQNRFRAAFWSLRIRGYSFEDSLDKAAEHIRVESPGFTPRWKGEARDRLSRLSSLTRP
jgi:hypothetical protein